MLFVLSFTIIAWYDFDISHRAGHNNAGAEFLSLLFDVLAIDDGQPFEEKLKAFAHYLDYLPVVG